MVKIIKPIKEKWGKIKSMENPPMELIMKGENNGIVRAKRLKAKKSQK